MPENSTSLFYFKVSKLDVIIGLLMAQVSKDLVNPYIIELNPYLGIPVFFGVAGFVTFVAALIGGRVQR